VTTSCTRTAAVLVMSVLVAGGCGAPPNQDKQIRQVADAMYAAMGVTDLKLDEGGTKHEKYPECGPVVGVKPEDAWWGQRSYALGPGRLVDIPQLYDRAVAHFRSMPGWQVQEFAVPTTERAFTARTNQMVVDFTGRAITTTITAGPCAPLFGGYGGAYKPIPPGTPGKG
jgi:hypothetical protein